MTADNFTEAARAEAERRYPALNPDAEELTYPRSALREHKRSAHVAGWEAARAHLAAQEPGVQHLWRPGASPRPFCGDESARPWVPVTLEESLAVPVCALCHRRAMHESYNLWADQDPTEAEVEAAAIVLCATGRNETIWQLLDPEERDSFRADARAALSAARTARRDEEK